MGFAILNEILIIDEKENIVSIMDKHEKTSKKIFFLFPLQRCLDFVWEQFSCGLGSKDPQNLELTLFVMFMSNTYHRIKNLFNIELSIQNVTL